jgi:lipopolysaccharide biosynthesis protein
MDPVRLIAFYLPQFHPIPENDRWWGKGFTEWTNVAKARALFQGHYQPHLPGELGFYDLRVPEVREAQAELAREHGVHGFCYYHYWFGGRRLLERPLDELVRSSTALPFCVCWANETWTRRWDGGDNEVLVAQQHTPEDDLRFIESLFPMFADARYIRVDGRPLLLVYRVDLFPDARRTAGTWRDATRRAGLGEPYLVSVESFGNKGDPRQFGFDAAVEFPGHQLPADVELPRERTGLTARLFDYPRYADFMMRRPDPGYKRFHAVLPAWDNTPRMGERGSLFVNAAPAKYGEWLREAVRRTREEFAGDERLVFVNAWNEWGEGCHLEPDARMGRTYLEITRDAVESGG